MEFLLKLPIWLGIIVVVIIITTGGLFVVTLVKKRIGSKIKKQHEKVGRLLFRVTAGLIALLISLSYANERIEQNKLIDSMELEASILVNVFLKLETFNSKEAKFIKTKLIEYIELTIDDDWSSVEANPFFSKSSKTLIEVYHLTRNLSTTSNNQEILKNDIISEVSQITKLMQVRIYSHRTVTPFLIYILLIGLVFMWVFFTVYNLDVITLTFLSLYNIFIAILIYFIFMLSNPLIGPLKLEPHSFMIIKTKGIDI